jgi:integrase
MGFEDEVEQSFGRPCRQFERQVQADMRTAFSLANKGHDTRALQAYLGHKNIQHTVPYTELSPDRFKDFWRN